MTHLTSISSQNQMGKTMGLTHCSMFNAKRILEKTLGKVSGYQSDDGILEHECAISAMTKLYENNGIVPQKENNFRFSYTKTTYFNYCSTCPHSRFHDDDNDCAHNRCELLNKYIHCYLNDGDESTHLNGISLCTYSVLTLIQFKSFHFIIFV